MCCTCGCMQPENKHGDDRNILCSEFIAAATQTPQAPGSTKQALKNVKKTLKLVRKQQGA